VGLVADEELEIGRGELGEETVVGGETLDGGDDDLRAAPVVALLFVDDRRDAVGAE